MKWRHNVQIEKVLDLKSNTYLDEKWDLLLEMEFALAKNLQSYTGIDYETANEALSPLMDLEEDETVFSKEDTNMFVELLEDVIDNQGFVGSVTIAVSASGTFDINNRGYKTRKYDKSEIWDMYTNYQIPIYYLLVHTFGTVIFLRNIWTSLYGSYLLVNAGIEDPIFKGMAILLFSEAVSAHRNVVYGIVDAGTPGSRNMFSRANIKLFTIDSNAPNDVESVKNDAYPPVKEWFNVQRLKSKEFKSLYVDEKRLKISTVCGGCNTTINEKMLYQCIECKNALYCSKECGTINNKCVY